MQPRDQIGPSPAPLTHRPELDGLRAVSVVAVLLYHLELPWISGGYAGVDVFFVISGFLITRMIRDAVRADDFRLRAFYLRRLRRLFPALFATVAVSFIAACLILPAADLALFAAMMSRSVQPAARVVVEKIDGAPAAKSPHAAVFAAAGFRPDMDALVRERSYA